MTRTAAAPSAAAAGVAATAATGAARAATGTVLSNSVFGAKFKSVPSTRSWLLYVLVLASLSLSILVFWLSLYKSQEAGMAVRALQEQQNDTVAKLVDARLAGLR